MSLFFESPIPLEEMMRERIPNAFKVADGLIRKSRSQKESSEKISRAL
jgi:hypothetical protein